jgi:hypothetical protein
MVLSSRSLFVAEFITRARELGERNVSPYTTLAHYSIVAKIGAGGMGGRMSKMFMALFAEQKRCWECNVPAEML